MKETIFLLFESSGVFAGLYRSAGYRVIVVDIQSGTDILDWDYKQYTNVVGIISHPPCTEYASSGARWWAMKPPELLEMANILVNKVLEIRDYFIETLRFWVLENPIGRIRKCVPEIGLPRLKFDPCDYALYAPNPAEEAYTKKTYLYGKFNAPLAGWVEPVLGSKMHTMNNVPDRASIRSKTPEGFARAFFNANR